MLPGRNTLDPMSFFVLPLAPTGCCHARDSYVQNTVWGGDTALWLQVSCEGRNTQPLPSELLIPLLASRKMIATTPLALHCPQWTLRGLQLLHVACKRHPLPLRPRCVVPAPVHHFKHLQPAWVSLPSLACTRIPALH